MINKLTCSETYPPQPGGPLKGQADFCQSIRTDSSHFWEAAFPKIEQKTRRPYGSVRKTQPRLHSNLKKLETDGWIMSGERFRIDWAEFHRKNCHGRHSTSWFCMIWGILEKPLEHRILTKLSLETPAASILDDPWMLPDAPKIPWEILWVQK